MSELGYRCWAGNFHPAWRIPDDVTADTLLQFECACKGSVMQAQPVRDRLERGEKLTYQQAASLAMWWHPPRHPVVRVGDLTSRETSHDPETSQ